MKVTRNCDFCSEPIELDVPDGFRVPENVAHTNCLPTPGAGGAQRITDERRRQIDVEGFNPEADLSYEHGELAKAALAYLSRAVGFDQGVREWPRSWQSSMWKPSPDPIRNLEKAGALIAAEIDRLIAEGTPS